MTTLAVALGQAVDLAEDDLDRPVDEPPLEAVLEHELERPGQVVALLRREPVGQPEVEQVSRA